MIRKETIDNIIEAARIEEVVGEFVNLRKRGANLLGLCPFHNEKTPSFSVSPTKGIYKCFGCGRAGNAVNFIMEHEHYTYPEALRYLAGRYHIEVEEDRRDDEDHFLRAQQESLYHLNQYALKFFSSYLLDDPKGRAIGLSYLEGREIRDDMISKFQLGFSPEEWDAFTTRALKDGYQAEHLTRSGLSIEKDGRMYDRFRARLIFPIHNLTGMVIGFGGRTLRTEGNIPKYVNSPESEIYSKSKSLYGLYQAKSAILAKNECYLVEGYTDVIALHQAGIENVVASSGTSLTQDQIKMISRYTPNITILYDGDEAGLKAAFRGIDMILSQGMNVRIVLFPNGEDPDSYSRNRSRNEVRDFIKAGAKNFVLFKAQLLLKEAGSDPILKATMIKEMVSSIALIPDNISRSLHLKECSQLTGIPEQSLIAELNRIFRQQLRKDYIDIEAKETVVAPSQGQMLSSNPRDSIYQEKNILRILFNYGDKNFHLDREDENGRVTDVEVNVAEFIIRDLEADQLEFENRLHNAILDIFREGVEKQELPGLKFFINHEDPQLSEAAINFTATQYSVSDKWAEKHRIYVVREEEQLKELVFESIYTFKLKKIEQMLWSLRDQLKDASEDQEIDRLLREQTVLMSSKQHISRELGRIITH